MANCRQGTRNIDGCRREYGRIRLNGEVRGAGNMILMLAQGVKIKVKKVKVKVTLVQSLRLCTGRTAYRSCRGIALSFHDHGTRRGLGVSVTPRPLFTPGKDPVPIV